MPKISTNASFSDFAKLLGNGEAFHCHGALKGSPGRAFSTGYLSPESRAAATADSVDYVVYSYSTPIAFHDRVTGWNVPDARYSVTTTRHQSKIRTAISVL